MSKSRILCRCKIIAPWMIVNTRPRRLRKCLRIIFRSRINDDALIAVNRRIFEPARQIMRLITRDGAGRDFERLLPFRDLLPKGCALLRHGEHRIIKLHGFAIFLMLSIGTKGLLHHLCRLRKSQIAREMLSIFSVKLRQAWKVPHGLLQQSGALLSFRQYIKQHAIAATGEDHRTRSLRNVKPRIMKGALRITHALIRLSQIAIEILRTFRLLQFPQEEFQVALRLSFQAALRIARMKQHQHGLRDEYEPQFLPLSLNVLVDTPHIANLR